MTKPFEKRKVKCPECEEELEIFTGEDNSGLCKCGIDCDAVFRTAHYQKLAKKVVTDSEIEDRKKKKRNNPFSFDMD